ncbi:uncharacterized protein [Gossypium hirsutum]|uniref:Uncharacterized protein n=1 Tax=Gossypium hirsutum TaxID=3635 RepID=A0ABM3BLC3_GOSHI|nr:uncharacterized protein LOC107961226 [Gossypium hirsutum]
MQTGLNRTLVRKRKDQHANILSPLKHTSPGGHRVGSKRVGLDGTILEPLKQALNGAVLCPSLKLKKKTKTNTLNHLGIKSRKLNTLLFLIRPNPSLLWLKRRSATITGYRCIRTLEGWLFGLEILFRLRFQRSERRNLWPIHKAHESQRGCRWPLWCNWTMESRTLGVGRADDARGRGTTLGGN